MARYAFFTQKSGKNYRITYSLEHTQDSILIFGSSHAVYHYIPKIFEDSLGLSCYNAGVQGQGILFTSTIEKIVLKRIKPKIIILNIDQYWLFKYNKLYDLLSDLYPYYYLHKDIIGKTLMYKSKYENVTLLSKLYQYNSTIAHIVKYKIKPQPSYKGYLPLRGQISMEDVEELNRLHASSNKYENEIDTVFVNALESFIKIGLDANCKIIFSVSPVVYNFLKPDNESFLLIQKIAKKHNIPILNYLRNAYFRGNYKLYKDKSHLNINGATYFSSIVAHDIKTLLQTEK
jgi:hypothetical protein